MDGAELSPTNACWLSNALPSISVDVRSPPRRFRTPSPRQSPYQSTLAPDMRRADSASMNVVPTLSGWDQGELWTCRSSASLDCPVARRVYVATDTAETWATVRLETEQDTISRLGWVACFHSRPVAVSELAGSRPVAAASCSSCCDTPPKVMAVGRAAVCLMSSSRGCWPGELVVTMSSHAGATDS